MKALLSLFCLTLMTLLPGHLAAQSTFVVNTTADSGAGSLRQAITDANAAAGADTITFSDGTGGTVNFTDATPEIIDLATGLPALSTDITITGPGADKLTIRRPAAAAFQFRILNVSSSTATVNLSGLTLTGGNTSGSGGGIRNDGTLTVTACAITGNSGGGDGGGIHSQGMLNVHSSTISGNTAAQGGGVGSSTSGFTATSKVTLLVNTTLSGNTAALNGGGFYNNIGLSYLVNCTLTGNNAPASRGGGVATYGASITETRFANTLCVGNTGGDVDFVLGTTNSSISLGGNLIGTGNSGANFPGQTTTAAASTILNTTLANNGGPTRTHALIPGSPALNAGVNANAKNPTDAIFGDANDVALTTDQRGGTFLRTSGIVDVGAFEFLPVAAPLASGVVSWWKAENNGTDSIGPNPGTLNGATAYAAGRVGQAFSFNGSTGNYVSTAAHPSLQLSSGTVEAWIKTSGAGSGYRGIIVKRYAYGIYLKDGLLIAFDYTSGDITSSAALADNNWHHVAITFVAGSSYKLYADGVEVGSASAFTVLNQGDALSIGAGDPAGAAMQNFNGLIDEPTIYNRALTPAEIQAIYAAGSSGKVASSNADLASLTTTAGAISPAFAAGTIAYSASVPNATNSVTVTPTVAQANASVTVNGTSVVSGTASAAINLNVGTNAIPVLVTAQDGTTTKTYTLTVTRAAASSGTGEVTVAGTNLGAIPDSDPIGRDILFDVSGRTGVVQTVSVQIAFNPVHTRMDNLRIQLFAPSGASAFLFHATYTRPPALAGPYTFTDAAVSTLYSAAWNNPEVLPSGNYLAGIDGTPVYLNLTFGGTAPNGTWRLNVVDQYDTFNTGTVSQASLTLTTTNAALSALSTNAGALSPAFDAATLSYSAPQVPSSTASVTVTAAAHVGATLQVRVNGGTYADLTSGAASAALPLNSGSNTIEVKVTSEDGTTVKTYALSVSKAFTGDPITPTAVLTTSQWVGPVPGVRARMIDGSGLSGGGSVLTQTHDELVTGETMWHAGPDAGGISGGVVGAPLFGAPPVNTQAIEFDLGVNYDLTAAHVWNMNQSGNQNRGVKDVQISFSSATTGAFSTPTSTQFTQGTGAAGLAAQVVPLTGASNVRRVRFAIQSAWSGLESEYVGLSEVRFQGTAAVPATPPILVTNISDSGPGSLRQAITDANANAGADTITFSDGTGGTVNFTDATPEIIDLATVLPDLSTAITISGPGADKLTIRRPAAATTPFSIFFVSSTATVNLSGLTLTGGDTINSGGGIRNDGTLTVTACAITGNTASNGGGISSGNNLTVHSSTISGNTAIRGGGVYSSTSGFTAASTVTHLVNTTLSGNTATTRGGGFYNENGLSYLVNCTLTGNSAQANQGGGVATVGNTSTVTRFANTLCVGNTGGDVDYFFGPTNSNISLGGSLIGTGNSIANFTGQTTAAAASTILNTTLASNGGPTLTHALIPGSPALNAGVNANATNPTDAIFGDANDVALTTDQRGSTFLRAFGTVDIGAFEEQPVPNTAPVIATYGTAHSLNFAENSTTPALDLDATDADLPAQTLTWSLSGTDAPLFSINSSGVLTFAAAPDFEAKNSYAVTATVTDNATPTTLSDSVALTITITNVNEAPTITDVAAQSTNEDTATAAIAFTIGDVDASSSLTVTASSSDTTLLPQANIALGGSGSARTITLTPAANLHGTADITVQVSDGSLTASDTFTLTVQSVNDMPSFALPGDQPAGAVWTQRGDAANWISIASSADGQKLVAASGSHELYTSTNAGQTWTAEATEGYGTWAGVASTADGGKLFAWESGLALHTRSAPGQPWVQDFQFYATSISSLATSSDGNKVATAASGYLHTSTNGGQTWTRLDEQGPSRVWSCITSTPDGSKLAAGIYGGPIYTSTDSGQSWTPQPGTTGNWMAIAISADGTKLIGAQGGGQGDGYLYLSSDGGPTWTAQTTQGLASWYSVAISADGSKLLAAAWDTQLRLSTNGGQTWSSQEIARGWIDVTMSADGSYLAAVSNSDDNQGNTLGHIYTSRAAQANPAVLISSGPQSYPAFATNISPGPANESGQTVTFTVTNTNNALFTVQPAIAPNGTLTFTAGTMPGTATISVQAVDNGGIANGGVDTCPLQTFTITVQSAYEAWAAANTLSSSTNYLLDSDADGVAALLEFAFGLNPNASDHRALRMTGTLANGVLSLTGQPIVGLEPTPQGQNFHAVFIRRSDHAAARLVYTPEFSATLNLWQPSAVTPTVLSDNGTYQLVTVPYPPFVNGLKTQFFRIKVQVLPTP